MEVQQEIAFDTASEKVGKTLRVIIDEFDGEQYIGRTEYDSPEVDTLVYLPSDKQLNIGHLYDVEITASEGFDLIGKVKK